MRRFRDLRLARERNPVFTLTWSIMHPIDVASPLFQWLGREEEADGFELIVVLSGTDERSGQMIHGRWAYSAKDVRWGVRFADILGQTDDGVRTIDYGRFDDVIEP